MVKLTRELIDDIRPQSGCFNYKTLRLFGVQIPLRHGWEQRMIDTSISENDFTLAMEENRRHILKLAKRDEPKPPINPERAAKLERRRARRAAKKLKRETIWKIERAGETHDQIESRIKKNWTKPITHDQSLAPWESEKIERYVEAASKSIGLPEYFI